jgi:hypothetical protein
MARISRNQIGVEVREKSWVIERQMNDVRKIRKFQGQK